MARSQVSSQVSGQSRDERLRVNLGSLLSFTFVTNCKEAQARTPVQQWQARSVRSVELLAMGMTGGQTIIGWCA